MWFKLLINELGEIMNKTELIDKLAETCDLSKAAAGQVVDSFADIITNALVNGEEVALVGFGTFSTSKRNARTGRNPQTGEIINIPAVTVPKFKAGKKLKDAVK